MTDTKSDEPPHVSPNDKSKQIYVISEDVKELEESKNDPDPEFFMASLDKGKFSFKDALESRKSTVLNRNSSRSSIDFGDRVSENSIE